MEHIAIHHTGGLGNNYRASTQHLSAEDVDRAHQYRSDWIGYRAHLSTLKHYGGYNFFVDRTGKVTQFRALGEETLAQRGYNFNTVSICLAGNFTRGVDTPTDEQIHALRDLIYGLTTAPAQKYVVHPGTTLNLSKYRVFPHRHYQGGTDCYGNSLSNSWAREQAQATVPSYNPVVAQIESIKAQIAHIMLQIQLLLNRQKLAGAGHSCEGFINVEK